MGWQGRTLHKQRSREPPAAVQIPRSLQAELDSRTADYQSAPHEALRPAFECLAVPLGQFRASFIGALAEIENRFTWRRSGAHVVVLQQELSHLGIPIGWTRFHNRLLESSRGRLGVRIKSRLLELSI